MHAETGVNGADYDLSGIEDRAASSESPIRYLELTVSVEGVVKALEDHKAWNAYGPRREQYVHSDMSDIWVRFNAWENYHGDLAAFTEQHESVWYQVAWDVPELRVLVSEVLHYVGDCELGGVLITKIPPGGSIVPHSDGGWHAEYFSDKYGVQLMGNKHQSFNFEGYSLSPMPGQVFWFDNSKTHWVTNDSNEDRMTMIICTRRVS